MAEKLKTLRYFKELAFINGKWINGNVGKTFPVLSPSTGEVIANIPDLNEDEIKSAIKSADDAFQSWRSTTCKTRSNLLSKLAKKMMDNKRELGTIMSMECGKPIQESLGEVNYAASFLEWFGEESKRINGDVLPIIQSNNRQLILKQPIGVCGFITPWNFPLAMITRKVGAAVAAGCSAVLKPSEETPLTALAFGQLLEDINSPAGLVNIITCSRDNASLAGSLLCHSNTIKKISFTGSTHVGRWLLEQSAPTVKKLSMELGGNAPFIVFNSADAKLAASNAVKSRFRNTGQTCICAERIFVQDEIYDEFLSEFKQVVCKLVPGDPLDMKTVFSCVINDKGLHKVVEHVADAVKHGATVVHGGKLHKEGSLMFEPTILADCTLDMKCIQEETFGPVAAIMRFNTEEEVLSLANTDASGLGGYFFSNDYKQIWRMSEKLEVGMVGVNDVAISHEMMPFGGVKLSGIGREGSVYGIDEYIEMKHVTMGGL